MWRLFQKVDVHSLVFLRIVFGILAFADVLSSWIYKHFYLQVFDPDSFRFTYYGFQWVQPFPEPFMSLFFILTLLASIGIAIGWRYRWCCTWYAVAFTYLFLLDKSFYLNHGYLFCWLSFLMIFLPAQHAFSADVLAGRVSRWSKIPFWPLFILRFTMGLVYFYGGLAKINADWLNGMPLKLWLKAKSDMPLLGPLWEQEWVAYFMSYGGLGLDLFVTFFLLSSRTRIWALLFTIFFHSVNLIIFKIGIFPFLSVAMTLMFFAPNFPLIILDWLQKRLPFIARPRQAWQRTVAAIPPSDPPAPSEGRQRWIVGLIGLYALIHMTLPFRQYYFPGPTAWTEEGHRYAWRMMLRSKSGYGNFTVKNLQTGETFRENPKDYLPRKAKRKMYTHPDMILQFAHLLRDQYHEKGMTEVAVYADIRVRLNGRRAQQYVDETVDLAKVEWSFFEPSEWILPFREEEEHK
ncbi:MAG: HTTM domain-containing protein [Bacteroidota bacterium]